MMIVSPRLKVFLKKSQKEKKRTMSVFFFFLSFVALPLLASSELVAWEGFEYDPGVINGVSLNGGFGFGEAWKIAVAQDNSIFSRTTKVNVSNLVLEGAKEVWNGSFDRTFESRGAMVLNDPVTTKSAFTRLISDKVKEQVALMKVVYVSFLYMAGDGDHSASFAFVTNELSSYDGTDVPWFSAAIGVISRSNGVVPARWGSFGTGPSAGRPLSRTPLLVVARFTWKFRFILGENDVVDVALFRPGDNRSAAAFETRKVTDSFDLNEANLFRISFRLENAAASELRIGTTFEDVAVVSLPTTPAPPTPPPAPTPPPTPLPPTIVIGGTTTTTLTPRPSPTPTPMPVDTTTSMETTSTQTTSAESIEATPALSSPPSLMPWLPIVIVVVLLCLCGMIVAVLLVLRRRKRERDEVPNNVDMALSEVKKKAPETAQLSRDSRQSLYAHAPDMTTTTSNVVRYGSAPPLEEYDRAPAPLTSGYDRVAEDHGVVYEKMQSALQF
jgi:hypothetical protein